MEHALLEIMTNGENMKTLTRYIVLGLVSVFLVQACGPSEEELRQREQARLDSLERVRMMQIEQTRIDSLTRVQRQAQEAERQREQEKPTYTFSNDGNFAVQVGSWRAVETAEKELEIWKGRGFENAYSVRFGEEELGDIWFRVRLGRMPSREDAELLQAELLSEYNAASWISVLN
jgi:cell division protein FtsN